MNVQNLLGDHLEQYVIWYLEIEYLIGSQPVG